MDKLFCEDMPAAKLHTYYYYYTDEMFPDGLDTQPGFKAFSQVPPTIYHVEEGQTMATLPCSKVTGFHSHGIL